MNFIAIDIESQGIFAVSGAARGAKVTHAVAWAGDGGDVPPALTLEMAKAVGEKLRDKLRASGAQPAPVLVTVGRDRVILKELKYPAVPPTEEPALVRFQAMKEMSESPEDIVLDYAPLGEAGGERRSMAVVMRRELFNAIQAMVVAAGLKLAGVTPRPYALAAGLTRAFAAGGAPAPTEKDDAVAALTLGPGGGEFTVVRRGEVTFTLAIPAPVVASETMLVSQIRRNLTVYAGQHPGHPVTAVYLSEVGGPWAGRLRGALSVPVHAFDPLATAVPDVPEALRGRFAGAVGLLAGRGANALPINFAAPRQPRLEGDPAKKRLALAALAAMLLLAVGLAAGIFFANLQTRNVDALTHRRDDLKSQVERGGPDATRLKAIDQWTGREVNWLDEMYELADRMPADDSARVLAFDAKPVAPDKNGKQDSQATVEVKIAATNTAAGTALADGFVKDNPTANKYYAGVSTSIGGLLTTTSKYNQSVTIRMKMNRRTPGEYTQNTRFTPPKRTTGSAGITASPPPVAAAPVEEAPPPTDKAATN
jgi:Tfp pilus assembly PilM family ATPase